MHPDYIENEYVTPVHPSRVLQNNIELLTTREQFGLTKYGTTLDRKDLTHEQFLQHGLEEALDLGMYLQAALQRVRDSHTDYAILRDMIEKCITKQDMRGTPKGLDREYIFGCEDTFEQFKSLLHRFDADQILRKVKR